MRGFNFVPIQSDPILINEEILKYILLRKCDFDVETRFLGMPANQESWTS